MQAERLLIPCVLAMALIALIIFPIPGANHDIVLSIVAGLLGALTNRATQQQPTPDQGTPPGPQSQASPSPQP